MLISNHLIRLSPPRLEHTSLLAPKGQRIEIQVGSVSFQCDNACTSFLELKYKRQKVTTGILIMLDPLSSIFRGSFLLWATGQRYSF